MSEVLFARPRHNYDSYRDLYRLIELSDYPLIYVDEIDADSDNTYILTLLNGENQHGWDTPRAQIILWDLEWRLNNPPNVPGVSRVWASDAWYAEEIGAQFVPFGSHPGLRDTADDTPQTDVAAMMYTGPYRRQCIINALRQRGVSVAGPAWGDVRAHILTRSWIMLHIHQHDNVPTIAPLRWALAAAYSLPVVSETVNAPSGVTGTVWADYDRLTRSVQRVLNDDVSALGAALYQAWCIDRPFRAAVEAAL